VKRTGKSYRGDEGQAGYKRYNDVPADVLKLLRDDGHRIVTQLINNVYE